MVTQLSLIPAELPDHEFVFKKKNRRSLRYYLKKYLNAEGFYNYAKLAKQMLAQSDEYIAEHYRTDRADLNRVLNSEFQHACAYQESIDSFLENLQREPNYKLENYNL